MIMIFKKKKQPFLDKEKALETLVVHELQPYLKRRRNLIGEIKKIMYDLQQLRSYKPSDRALFMNDIVQTLSYRYGEDIHEEYLNNLRTFDTQKGDLQIASFNIAIQSILNQKKLPDDDFVENYKRRYDMIQSKKKEKLNEKKNETLCASLVVAMVAQVLLNSQAEILSNSFGNSALSLALGGTLYYALTRTIPQAKSKREKETLDAEIEVYKSMKYYAKANVKEFKENELFSLDLSYNKGKFELKSCTEANLKDAKTKMVSFTPLELALQK